MSKLPSPDIFDMLSQPLNAAQSAVQEKNWRTDHRLSATAENQVERCLGVIDQCRIDYTTNPCHEHINRALLAASTGVLALKRPCADAFLRGAMSLCARADWPAFKAELAHFKLALNPAEVFYKVERAKV